MILSTRQIYLMRLGRPVVPANFGGDSDSDSSTQTTANTTNNTDYNDKRAVGSDSAVSLSGDRNVVDRSSSTSFTDTSNRSSTSLTSFLDTSNRANTTTFTDNSDRHVVNTTTDFGSVSAALGLAGTMTAGAYGVANNGINGAIEALKLQSKNGVDMVSKAFDLAKSSAANSQQSGAQLMGFATDALQATQSAMADAKDSGQSKMVIYAIGAIAVIGVAFALKR
jgi:hypothetical protein